MAGSKPSEEVHFQPKSGWQKDDCINSKCGNPSTLEAVAQGPRVRCCIDEECKKIAAETALASKIN